jgi:small GTP-binding protein
MDELKIVLAGHIDHGKSTLIGRLLYETGSLSQEMAALLAPIAETGGEERAFAYVLDHLAEERADNITIDTAQVFLRRPDRHYVLIDAPGHKEFVSNMVTGASQADAALLIVAANDGVCEQTRRHCNLLALLGVRQIVIAVNKMDKVMYSRRIYEFIRDELTRYLAGLGLTAAAIVPMSAQRGENLLRPSERLAWYAGKTLMAELEALSSAKRVDSMLVVPVQDVYADGWAAGRVEAGQLSAGQRVTVNPGGQAATVEELSIANGPAATAATGWCVAMKLSGAMPARGMTLSGPGLPLPAHTSAKAKLFWMSHQPLRPGEQYLFHCATQGCTARVVAIDRRIDSATMETIASQPAAGEPGAPSAAPAQTETAARPPAAPAEAQFTDIVEVRLEFDQPVVYLPFGELPELGRFTLSQDKEVVAGGIF